MKRIAIMQLQPKKTRKTGRVFTAQVLGDILILNYWEDQKLNGRYCISAKTHEYEIWKGCPGVWKKAKLANLMEHDRIGGWYDWYLYYEIGQEVTLGPEDKKVVLKTLQIENSNNIICAIGDLESKYNSDQRENKEKRRIARVKQKMDKVPKLPSDFKSWIHKVAAAEADYAFFDKETQKWNCTACGKTYTEKSITAQGGKIKNNEKIRCPGCGKMIQAKKRSKAVSLKTNAMVLQDIDQEMSVSRHIDVEIVWTSMGREVKISEAIRIMLLRAHPKYSAEVYYNQWAKSNWEKYGAGYFDRRNPSNRRLSKNYLYPAGIQPALQNTEFELWSKIFGQMATAGIRLDYNSLLVAQEDENIINAVEYLFKGRFWALLRDTVAEISYYTFNYYGPLNLTGTSIEEVFGLEDRQKINRIRDCDGGVEILKWMKLSEETGKKIDQETLEWLVSQKIETKEMSFVLDRMSPRKVANYVKKQKEDQYKEKSIKGIIQQWADYLNMCDQLKRDTNDEMVYRPRELKRRHEEVVEEIRKQRAIEQMKRDKKANREAAERMREKYPGAEENLKKIKAKYEYQNAEYRMIVPGRLMEIVEEGNALHHCAGATERYFERIMQHETYICFLRRESEPKIPFYTIEIEPGGTIRQHRSYDDEEPGIEEIRGFLREWQREIKKRLKAEDHKLAKKSAEKRRKNIEELQAKNNLRVLKGLEEDFMEAI